MDSYDRNRKDRSIYFADAMNKIDKKIDYNEYSEVNSSEYFKESLYKAEDELDRMMASPLMNNFRKYKKPKLSINLMKKNKDYLLKRLNWVSDKIKDKDNEKTKNNKAKILKRLKKINKNKNIFSRNENNESGEKNNLLPIIHSETVNNETYNRNDLLNKEVITERNTDKYYNFLFSLTGNGYKHNSVNEKLNTYNNNKDNNPINTKLMNISTNSNRSLTKLVKKNKANDLETMYNKCIKGLENLEKEEEKRQKIMNSHSYKLNKSKALENTTFIGKNTTEMTKFLVENINLLNKTKSNDKEKKMMKNYFEFKLKKDPLMKLSDRIAYKHRKPLMTMFHLWCKEEKKFNSPLEKIRITDKHIMRKLEKDNRNKNLLMKRLDEDQARYIKDGYFFMNKEDEKDLKKPKPKNIVNMYTNYDMNNENGVANNIKGIKQIDSNQ